MSVIPEYTEGVCGDGAVFLCDGVWMPITDVLERLNSGARMERALGIALDALADTAWGDGEIDAPLATVLLFEMGVTRTRPATEDDIALSDSDLEIGDDWHELTPEAEAIRAKAMKGAMK